MEATRHRSLQEDSKVSIAWQLQEVTHTDLIFKAIYWKAMFFGIMIPTIAFCCFYYLSYRQQQEFLKKLQEKLDK